MSREDVKHAVISLLVGLTITFLTSLLDGIIHIIQNASAQWIGGSTGAVTYIYRHYRGLWIG